MRTILRVSILLGWLLPWSVTFACTVFTATNEKTTLVGNNEDMFHAGSKVEFHASQDGKYGRVFFGMGRNLHQGGMNEQGLFFDCVAVGPAERTLPKTKPDCPGGLVERALEDCATIGDVIELFDRYDSTYMSSYVTIFVDALGEGLVAQGGIIQKKDRGFFAVGVGERTANERLGKRPDLSVDLFRSIASDAHVEGVVKTLYSNIYDLRNKVIYLYYYYDFDRPLKIELPAYLRDKGTCTLDLAGLFSERHADVVRNTQAVSREYWKSAKKMDSGQFSKYTGAYSGQGIDIEVAQADGQFQIRFLGSEPYELVPLSAREFAVVDAAGGDARIRFVKKGRLSGLFRLEADLPGWQLKAERKNK